MQILTEEEYVKQMAYWLMKSEPEAFSIDDLAKRPKKREPWDGVRNYQARNFMRDAMKIGDLAFFYHSNCKVPGIVGVMKIAKSSYPDHTQFDPESKYFDPKSSPDNPRWFLVDVEFKEKFKNIVSLTQLKLETKISSMKILQKGNRLSITPITKLEWQHVIKLGKKS